MVKQMALETVSQLKCTGFDYDEPSPNPMIHAFGIGPRHRMCGQCKSFCMVELPRIRKGERKIEHGYRCVRRGAGHSRSLCQHSNWDACSKFETKQ